MPPHCWLRISAALDCAIGAGTIGDATRTSAVPTDAAQVPTDLAPVQAALAVVPMGSALVPTDLAPVSLIFRSAGIG
jgi:hypothetical protein